MLKNSNSTGSDLKYFTIENMIQIYFKVHTNTKWNNTNENISVLFVTNKY